MTVEDGNKTKWPTQVRDLILVSDPDILDFWFLDRKKIEEKKNWRKKRRKIFGEGKGGTEIGREIGEQYFE